VRGMEDKKLRYELFIHTTPETLWRAIVDGEFTRKYMFGTVAKTTARKGEPIVYTMPDGKVVVEGVILESEPPRLLKHTWVIRYDEKFADEKSTVTYEIEKRGAACKLIVTHDVAGAPETAEEVGKEGWTIVLSGLKTLLETGEPLAIEMPGASQAA
jgi:uncharacterized protein YndB with AHSA1/START domain